MDYPILISGEKAGMLTVKQDGLYTVFEARLPASKELTRLWVAGGGKSACLGLMEPRKDERYLCRRLSGAAMRDFPSQIEYAATAEPEAETADAPPQAAETQEEQEAAGDEGRFPNATGPPEKPEPPDKTAGGTGEGLLWFTRPDGSLTAFDGGGSLIALPASLRRRGPGLRLRTIGGREYIVFRY